MLSFDVENLRFQFRAAAVFTDGGFIFLHRLEGDQFWSLPGGRVEPGEEARYTVQREMLEELSEPVKCGDLLFVVENFFESDGHRNQEIGFYFGAELSHNSTLRDKSIVHIGAEGPHRLEFRWFSQELLAEVDLRPAFLRKALLEPVFGVRHIVQRS